MAQHVLSRGDFGEFLSVNIAWGIGVTLGCYVGGGVSGMVTLISIFHTSIIYIYVLP